MNDELPIKKAESDLVAQEFLRRWTPQKLAEQGLHDTIREILYHLQDHGDVIVLTVNELVELTGWLCETGIDTETFSDDSDIKPELSSALKKIFFAHGRNWGMTNYDMGIQEEDDERE